MNYNIAGIRKLLRAVDPWGANPLNLRRKWFPTNEEKVEDLKRLHMYDDFLKKVYESLYEKNKA